MENICKLCGSPLDEKGVCTGVHGLKRMCLNCNFCQNEENSFFCVNETNTKNALEKIKAMAKEKTGYEITNLELKPLSLKKPQMKCGNWMLADTLKTNIEDLFS